MKRQSLLLVLCFIAANTFAQGNADDYIDGAKAGNPEDMYQLGNCYKFGRGVDVDLEKACYWWGQAANKDHASAEYNLGMSYYRGEGVGKDVGIAAFHFYESATHGNLNGMYMWGICLYNGYGVFGIEAKPDKEGAVKMWGLAASQGHLPSMSDLAKCYYNGDGVSRDKEKAAGLFTLAASQGHVESMYYLGKCYYKGFGVPKDKEKAKEWLLKAEKRIDELPQECRHELREILLDLE